MKHNLHNLWKFNWLVRLTPSNLLMLLILAPFLYFFWLYKVVQLAEEKLSKRPNVLFRFFLGVFILGLLFVMFVDYIAVLKPFNTSYDFIFWSVYLSFVYVDYYITVITHKVENKNGTKASLVDKVGRFILLSTLMFGAFLLQPTVNKLFLKIKN